MYSKYAMILSLAAKFATRVKLLHYNDAIHYLICVRRKLIF